MIHFQLKAVFHPLFVSVLIGILAQKKKNKQHFAERVITVIHVLSVKKRTGAQNPDQTYMIKKKT